MLQDHVVKGLSNFRWELLKVSHHLTKSDGHRDCGIGDIMATVCNMI